ncbi:MAG: CDP-alcohol phosphatidyltransferase family protein [Nocardioidaceae bacterium]|nr:CDP-alcohol phosphatidyltransferase family protein [Nocardioidaceae bacterium]
MIEVARERVAAVASTRSDDAEQQAGLAHGWVSGPDVRVLTAASVITVVRTLVAVALGLAAAAAETSDGALRLLIASLVTYWIGDILDGAVARWRDHETRFGGVLDVVCDRACALVFYVGVAWHLPGLVVPVGVYLLEFAVVDLVLSLAFVAWPVLSPNYFYLVDRAIWRWNWSKTAKAVNSAAFALLLLLTENVWLCTAIAAVLLVLKVASLVRLVRLGIPVPGVA